MIYKIVDYWVDKGTPTKEDIVDAIAAAEKEGCTVCLNWYGPGYTWYGDTYSKKVTAESNPDEIYDSLPKIYGI